ncbi:flagellar biosynthesis repressor FlbT [Polycladidibacter hongkongensis]|uniref:flagellar biosynthesis repressor FlbT n=1 Tax=Polycladidibacter hongkongensis TaxID=1647556 RepID=UPI000831B09A|nr:flagellar biosynthesis repressor FlbT [Pseudovibrio hongkongensis]
MALKVELKPGEQVIIGQSVVSNGGKTRARLIIEGDAPILRSKDIMPADTASSPASRIYLAVQTMYLAGSADEMQPLYVDLTNQIVKAAPSTLGYVTEISSHILAGNFYGALKQAQKLIEYERTLIGHVSASNPSLSKNSHNGD